MSSRLGVARRLRQRATDTLASQFQRRSANALTQWLVRRFGPDRFRTSPPTPAAAHLETHAFRPTHFPQRGRSTRSLSAHDLVEAPRSPRNVTQLTCLDRASIAPQVLTDLDAHAALEGLARAGVPFELTDRTTQPNASGLAIGRHTAEAISMPHRPGQIARELRSVRIRRSAWRDSGLLTKSTVSVLLASLRPDDLLGAIEQVNRQVDVDIQLIVGLHGPEWGDGWEQRIARSSTHPLHVRRADAQTSFGALLTMLWSAADGTFVTKWDDDDVYGPHHLVDLVHGLLYSGAQLVGKAAEFVYLVESDRTIRRFAVGAESYATSLAGGTLLAERAWMDTIGWWPAMRAGVDRHAIESTIASGGRCYRTHGFEYVLRRSGDGGQHTWAAADSYFAQSAVEQRRGLDLSFAGFDDA